MPNTISIARFPLKMKRGARLLIMEFTQYLLKTLEAVNMIGMSFKMLCHIMKSWKRSWWYLTMHIQSLKNMCVKCKWFRVNLAGANQTIIQDECEHTRLKISATSYQPSHWQTSEPFTSLHHVEQCFYLPYPPDPEEWSLIVTYVPRSCSIIGEKAEVVLTTFEQDDDQV
jgi:hypothetical protein